MHSLEQTIHTLYQEIKELFALKAVRQILSISDLDLRYQGHSGDLISLLSSTHHNHPMREIRKHPPSKYELMRRQIVFKNI